MTVLITTADLIGLYESVAASCEGMPRSLLAAVHETETSFGRGPGDPRRQERSSWMRPSPATRDGDGVVRVDDLEDAVYSAANLPVPQRAWTLPREHLVWPRLFSGAGFVGCLAFAFSLPSFAVVAERECSQQGRSSTPSFWASKSCGDESFARFS
ncbi:MAG: hypothetical protein M3124_06290 [Actinomycetota bacterium]|nr:hypothetical protein [Actinomycetota bacterium]